MGEGSHLDWLKSTIPLLLCVVPAAALLATVYIKRVRDAGSEAQMPLAFWPAALACCLCIFAIANLVFNLSEPFRVTWPLAGMVLSFIGVGLAFATPRGDREKLLGANVLLLIVSLATMVFSD
jgi:hypothetical protein